MTVDEDRPVMVVEEGGFGVLIGDVFHAVDTDLMVKLGVTHMLCTAKRCRYPPSAGPRQVRAYVRTCIALLLDSATDTGRQDRLSQQCFCPN
eukprot:1195437-Prorocentrum_minimum.AAC.1